MYRCIDAVTSEHITAPLGHPWGTLAAVKRPPDSHLSQKALFYWVSEFPESWKIVGDWRRGFVMRRSSVQIRSPSPWFSAVFDGPVFATARRWGTLGARSRPLGFLPNLVSFGTVGMTVLRAQAAGPWLA